MKTIRQPPDTRIPRIPFLWLTAALVFTVPPMFGSLAWWVPVAFLSGLAAKFWMEPRDYRLRSPVLKLVIGAIILGAVLVTYGSTSGIEPGVSIIVALMSLKILEAHTARDLQVMVMMAWILCLCGFFLSQDFVVALCLAVAFTLAVVALLEFHGGGTNRRIGRPLLLAGRLLAQAAPVAVLLFLLFPRVNLGFRFQIAPGRFSATGFSGQLSPGSVASLATSTDIAFRAEFPDGRIPPPGEMYWRGSVMLEGDGFDWRGSEGPAAMPRSSRRPPQDGGIHQSITIEPHGEHWLFALDRPLEPPGGATVAPGNYLWSSQPIRKPRRYDVTSFPQLPKTDLHTRERKLALEVPPWISPAVRQLAQSWVTSNPAATVRKGLEFFQQKGFRYSLTPGEYTRHDLEEFLFRRRSGFCEHYAATFATLMRLAGVPARVVVGYLGGEYNELGRFFLIRQADTHAWCEVWLPQTGWTRVDPTSVVAPDRVNLGLTTFLERRAAAAQVSGQQGGIVRGLANTRVFTNLRQIWESLSYAWDTHVLSFDNDAQESFVGEVGFSGRDPWFLMLAALVLCLVLAAIYLLWGTWRTRIPGDRVRHIYEQFCRYAARRGAERQAWEGPVQFSKRAIELLPEERTRISGITQSYIGLRYSAAPAPAMLDRLTSEVRAFGRRRTDSGLA